MNKRDSARILALGCHPVHTYSCLFALTPRWHLEHLFRPAPHVTFCNSLLPLSTHMQLCIYRVPRRRLPVWLPAADAIPMKTCGTPRKFMSNSRKHFTPLSHVRPKSLFFLFTCRIRISKTLEKKQLTNNLYLEKRSVHTFLKFSQLKITNIFIYLFIIKIFIKGSILSWPNFYFF